ncbi:MAG TPA: hypothetical protein PKJ45_11420 [Rubrivivax sp.]|nr:hypothetical protein [Burkholderiales bacterium]HNU11952.1 hypothetical protein [Rubrivivax sp.]
MHHSSPRHYLPTAALPGAGLPDDRMARLAARKAFVELKLSFLEAVKLLNGRDAQWLYQQVHHAEEPVDLWMLRGPLFDALRGSEPERRVARLRLRRGLDSLFPDTAPASAFGSL